MSHLSRKTLEVLQNHPTETEQNKCPMENSLVTYSSDKGYLAINLAYSCDKRRLLGCLLSLGTCCAAQSLGWNAEDGGVFNMITCPNVSILKSSFTLHCVIHIFAFLCIKVGVETRNLISMKVK